MYGWRRKKHKLLYLSMEKRFIAKYFFNLPQGALPFYVFNICIPINSPTYLVNTLLSASETQYLDIHIYMYVAL